MPLDRQLIERLMSGRRKTKNSTAKRYALVRNHLGELERVPLKAELIGKFEGKVGTARRSRKGRTYRAPNGSRYYAPSWGSQVVAYKA